MPETDRTADIVIFTLKAAGPKATTPIFVGSDCWRMPAFRGAEITPK